MKSQLVTVRLEDVATVNPRRPELSRAPDALTTFVPMVSVNEKLGTIDKAELRPFQMVSRGYTYFEEGDILFAKITPCMQNGKHAIARDLSDGIGFGTTEFHVLRPGPELKAEWLLHYLRRHSVLKSATRSFKGSVGLQRVPDMFLRNLEIPLPSLELQIEKLRLIRTGLEESRRAADLTEIQLNHAKQLDTSFLRNAFGDLPPISAGPLPIAKRGWTCSSLLSLARLESGHTPSRRQPEWWGGDVPWLALPDIRKLHGKLAYTTTENTNAAGLANSSARLLPVNTVCLCRDASIGFVTQLGRPMATSQHFCNWICEPGKLDAEFLLYAFMASHDYLRELGSGSVLKTIYMPTIRSFHICAPALPEQKRIAQQLRERLAATEALQARLAARRADLEQLPQRILAAAFAMP